MKPQNLNSGDRVVDLAGLTVSAAVVTGAIASAWLIWIIKKSWLVSAGAFIAGIVVGFGVGQLVARIFYRTGENTTVVKVGRASLSSTIPAGIAGGVATAIVVGLVALLIFSVESQVLSLFGVAIGCGTVLGVLFACLGSLT